MKFLERFDHPIFFIFFMLLAITGLQAVLTWGAKEMGWAGLANLMQHP